MKIHEYNEMMAYLTRPAPRQPVVQGGVIGKGGMFQGEDLGYRTGFRKLTEEQKEAKRVHARKTHAEKIASRVLPSFNILGKKVTLPKGFKFDLPGVGIEQSRASIVQGFKNLQKWLKNPTPQNWIKYFKKSMFGLQFRKYLLGRTEGPKMGAVTKFLDTIGIKKRLSKSQLDKINKLTTGGKGVSLRSIGAASLNNPGNLRYPEAQIIETIRDFQNGEKWLKANPNPDAIDPVTGRNIYRDRASAIRGMIKEQSKLGGFPFGDNSEKKLWSNLYRASYRGDRIKIVGEFANGELPINPETGKVDWKMKNKNNVAAWKRVQFIDTQAPKQAVFTWGKDPKNFQRGDFKKQIDKVFGNGFFDKSTDAYDVQAKTGSKRLSSGVTIKHDLKNRILKVDLLTQSIKDGNKTSRIPTKEEIALYIKKKAPRFNLTEVHHPMGVGRDPYLTEPAFRFANRKLAKVEDAIRAGTMNLADAKVEIDNINKKIGPIRTYLDDGYYGSKGGATQKSILESANKMIKTLLSSADKPTIMAIRKALGCGLASGGRVGLQGGGNLLDCPMAKFAQDPEGTLNIVGRAVPETRTPIMNAFKKFGMGTLKWGGRAFIGLTPVFAAWEIQEASEKFEEGVPAGQIAMDVVGNWVLPGAGGLYKQHQTRKKMQELADPEELASFKKADKRRWYEMLQEDPLSETDYSKQLEESEMTEQDKLNLSNLEKDLKDLETFKMERLSADRTSRPLPEIDPFQAAEGGRVGFDKGTSLPPLYDSRITGVDPTEKLPFSQFFINYLMDQNEKGYMSEKDVEDLISGKDKKGMDSILLEYKKIDPEKLTEWSIGTKLFGDEKGIGFNFSKKFNEGGRVGFDKGSPKDPTRRLVLKGITAAATLPFIGKYFKLGKLLTKAGAYTGPAIQKIKGMPEWFPNLVKKLWNEGEDVTKQVAYGERQVVRRGTLEGGDDVDLVYDLDTGNVSIDVNPPINPKTGYHSYETKSGAFNKEYSLDYKKGLADETTKGKKPPDEFQVTETEPVRTGHPEDPDWDWDGIDTNVDDALTDLTELEAFAKSKSTKQIHKKKGTKKKDVNPEVEYPEYDYDDYDID